VGRVDQELQWGKMHRDQMTKKSKMKHFGFMWCICATPWNRGTGNYLQIAN